MCPGRPVRVLVSLGLQAAFFSSLSPEARCQPALDPTWPENPKTFGGPGDDAALGAALTRDGGSIVVGVTTATAGSGDGGVLLIKLDARGSLDAAWPENPKVVEGEGPQSGSAVAAMADGGYVVVGTSRREWVGPTDIVVFKIDRRGELDPEWPENPRTFGGPSYDDGADVQATSEGGCIIAGSSISPETEDSDIYVIKLDDHGELDPTWAENPCILEGRYGDKGSAVLPTPDGGYVVAGSLDPVAFGRKEVCLFKLDSRGALDSAWSPNPKTFGVKAFSHANTVKPTVDGGYILGGMTENLDDGERSDALLTKLDPEGELDPGWRKNPLTIGGPLFDEVNDVQPMAEGGYLCVGYTGSSGQGPADATLIKLDAREELDADWAENPVTFGGAEREEAYSVAQADDGSILVAGYTESFGAGGYDVYLIKLASDTQRFVRGDSNGGGHINITDAVRIFLYLFNASLLDSPMDCLDAADANDSGNVDITDGIYLLGHLFHDGYNPPAPFPACGPDPTPDALTCETRAPCESP